MCLGLRRVDRGEGDYERSGDRSFRPAVRSRAWPEVRTNIGRSASKEGKQYEAVEKIFAGESHGEAEM